MADEQSSQTGPGDREGAAAELGRTLINEELYRRPSRAPDYEAENRALAALAQVMAESPKDLLRRLVEAALELCRADSAGISILEEGGGHGIFRWHAIAGAFAPNLHGTMPRELSACGTVLERDTALLFDRPARHFTDLAGAGPPIFESLLASFHSKGKTVGTVWAIAHSPERKFDSEDARLLESLSRFASAAYQMIRALDAAQEGKEKLELRVRERTSELASVNEALRRSETQLQTLFDEAPLGVYLVDGNFRIRQVNPAALPVFGDIPDLIGRDFAEVIHILWSQSYADELVERFQHTLETGESYFVVERIEQRRDSGVTEYYEWQINRITLPEGGYGVVCYFRDVSAPVLARRAIAESEENYRTLFEAIDEGFCTVEVLFDENERPVDYRFLQVNPSFERQTGIINAAGKTMREVAPQHEEHWFETYGKVALTGEPARFENQAVQLGRWYDVYAFRVGDPQLGRVGILFKDITARKRAEESQRRAAELDAFRVALADALRPLGDPIEIQREAMHVVGERLAADRVLYAEIGDDGDTITVADNYVRGRHPKIVGQFPASDWGTAAETLRAGRTFDTPDVNRDENLPDAVREAVLALGIASCVVVPLVKNGRWVSNLGVYHGEPRAWTPDEIGLLEEAAERTWAAVERARAEERLRRSEERMQRVLETDTVGVVFFDQTSTIIDANNAFLKMTGYSRAEVEARELSWRRLTPPEWIPESEAQVAKLEATGRIGPYEKEYILKDGSRKWMLFAGRDIGDGTTSEYCIDVTDRKRAEEELRRAHDELEERVRERTLELAQANVSLGEEVRERRAAEEQIKKLLKQLVTVQEEERLRIARDIHDQMGQQMSALRMNLSSLHARCDGETELAEQSRRTLALAEELDQSIDFLTWELRPAALDHLGLSAALANLVHGWSERFHITAEYHASGVDSLRLPPDSEINLYRLAQEALHNVYKHAGATNVGVFLERRDGHVVLIVEDDGRGFDPEEVSHDSDGAGMGLIGMRERATLVGGELDVESSPGSGTTVYVRALITLSGDGGAGR